MSKRVVVAALVSSAEAKTIGAWHKRPYIFTLPSMPDTPPRLERIFQSYDPPLYFVTFNTYHRRKLLGHENVHIGFVDFARNAETRGIGVGKYVIMPDHIHLFVRGGPDFLLTQWIRMLKRVLSKVISAKSPHWQKGFFDHLIRHNESYAEKWDYVRENPVRAGFVTESDAWPWQGEVVALMM